MKHDIFWITVTIVLAAFISYFALWSVYEISGDEHSVVEINNDIVPDGGLNPHEMEKAFKALKHEIS